MKLELGFQPGHSEDMVLIAHFHNSKEAEAAVIELARFIIEVETSLTAAGELENLSDKDRTEYLEECMERWSKICSGEHAELEEGFDWWSGDASIGSDGNILKFGVYSAGSGLTAISGFLTHQGAFEVNDGDNIGMSNVPFLVKEFKRHSGLTAIAEKGAKYMEKKNVAKAKPKRP